MTPDTHSRERNLGRPAINNWLDRLRRGGRFWTALLLWNCWAVVGTLRAAEVVEGFTGPFASDQWTPSNRATFFGTDSVVIGVSSFGPTPSTAEISVTVPTAGTLTATTEVNISTGPTGLGFGSAAILVDGQPAPWNGFSLNARFRAGQRLTLQVSSQDQPIPFHPGSYGGGPSVSLRLFGLQFTPTDPVIPLVPATGKATVVNGFIVGVSVTEAGRGYASRPGVRFVEAFGGGSGARAIVELTGDQVSGVRITSPGAGYTGDVQVLIDPPGGRTGGMVAAWGSDRFGESTGPRGLPDVANVWAGAGLSIVQRDHGRREVWMDPAQLTPGFEGRSLLNLNDVAAVAAGDQFGVTLWQGNVRPWGNYPPLEAWDGWLIEKPARALAAGASHILVLAEDGTVSARGEGAAAVVPTDLAGIAAIAAGSQHSLALGTNGTVQAWGDNSAGQSSVPAGLPLVRAIAAGGRHSLALTVEGVVIGWGDSVAATVPGNLGRARAIAAGDRHSLALLEDGSVVAWDDNSEGQLDVPAGVGRVNAIAAGGDHSLALHEPPAAVSITAAVKLDFRWTAGRSYQLESSTDLQQWTAVGAPEVADGATTTQVLATGPASAFYRLRELP